MLANNISKKILTKRKKKHILLVYKDFPIICFWIKFRMESGNVELTDTPVAVICPLVGVIVVSWIPFSNFILHNITLS